jgi:hypothetical protein
MALTPAGAERQRPLSQNLGEGCPKRSGGRGEGQPGEPVTHLQAYLDQLKPNVIVREPLFPEPVQVMTIIGMDDTLLPAGG